MAFEAFLDDLELTLLSTRELTTSTSHFSVETLRQRFDELQDVCISTSLSHLFFRYLLSFVAVSQLQIEGDCSVVQDWLLTDDCDMLSEGFEIEVSDIMTVYGDLSSQDVVETFEKLDRS